MAAVKGLVVYLAGMLVGAFLLSALMMGFVLTMAGAGMTALGGYVARAGDALVLFVGEHCEDFE